MTVRLGDKITDLPMHGKKKDLPTNLAADRMAEERIETVSRSRRAFLGVNPGPLRQLEFRRD